MNMSNRPEILKNGINFIQMRFPHATVTSREMKIAGQDGKEITKLWVVIAQDPDTGMKQRGVVIEDLGSHDELLAIANAIPEIFDGLDQAIYVKMGNTLNPTGQEIDNTQMVYAARVILYTNITHVPFGDIFSVFNAANILVDVIDESHLHKTLFISYGGQDEKDVSIINRKLKGRGIKTWFFAEDALPGEKLHRVMHDGVNNYDRVLLVCSKHSLSRKGVLNEIERALEREAHEGGSEVIIPIALDDYVYSEWAPDRKDIANQIRSRVIAKVDITSDKLDTTIEKIVKALKN